MFTKSLHPGRPLKKHETPPTVCMENFLRNTFAQERGEGCSALSADAVTMAVRLEMSGQNSTSESHVVRKSIERAIHGRAPAGGLLPATGNSPRVARGRLLQVLTEVLTSPGFGCKLWL